MVGPVPAAFTFQIEKLLMHYFYFILYLFNYYKIITYTLHYFFFIFISTNHFYINTIK